jgi:flagellar basal-body rod protein FlgC
MSFFNSIRISATGLTAERLRMDLISNNIANANTTKTSAGTPYRRKIAVFREQDSSSFEDAMKRASGASTGGQGVEVASVKEDMSDFKKIYDPTHPDADSKGYVLMPNVDTVSEMVNLISASRAYDANVTVINSTKSMLLKALDIGR